MSEYKHETTGGRIVLNAQQSEAVKTVEGPVLLLAVPGSGKTTVLVLRLGYMILNCGIAPENMKGSAPIRDIASQLTPTIKKPSLIRRSSVFWLGVVRSTIWPTRMTGRLHSRKMRKTSHSL